MSDAGFSFNFTSHTQFISKLKIGVVYSLWNNDITVPLFDGCLQTLEKHGITRSSVITMNVPGAFELPLGAQKLFSEYNCDAVIALGCVIKGDTPHFDYICEGCTQGIMNTILKFNKPIGFGLLTTLNLEQAKERTGGKHGHKGKEAAETVLQQLVTFNNL